MSEPAKAALHAICAESIEHDTLKVATDDLRKHQLSLSDPQWASAITELHNNRLVKAHGLADGASFVVIPTQNGMREYLQNSTREHLDWLVESRRAVAKAICDDKCTSDNQIRDSCGVPKMVSQFWFREFSNTGELEYPNQETNEQHVIRPKDTLRRFNKL